MKKKKVLIYTLNDYNFKSLLEYYKMNLEDKIIDEIDLIIENNKTKNKIMHLRNRFMLYTKKYDIVLSDYFTWCFLRSKKNIYICHGYGTKKTPGNDEIKNKKFYNICKIIRKKVDFIVTLSDWDKEYFYKHEKLRGLPEPEYIPLGLPRNDNLITMNENREKLKKDLQMGQKVLLYAPTWRGYDINGKFPMNVDDFRMLNKYLTDNGWIMIYKPHPSEAFLDKKLYEDCDRIIDFRNKNVSLDQLLIITDLLITDYSSIYVDYLLLNKPLAFMPFDLERYNNYRGLVIDFNSLVDTPGPKIFKLDDLMCYLKDIDGNKDLFSKYRGDSLYKFHKYNDEKSSERIWTFILKVLKEDN